VTIDTVTYRADNPDAPVTLRCLVRPNRHTDASNVKNHLDAADTFCDTVASYLEQA